MLGCHCTLQYSYANKVKSEVLARAFVTSALLIPLSLWVYLLIHKDISNHKDFCGKLQLRLPQPSHFNPDLRDSPRYDPPQPVALHGSTHGVCLPGSCLSVGHDGPIVAIHQTPHHLPTTLGVDVLLAGIMKDLAVGVTT